MFEKENLKELVLEDLTWVAEGMKKSKNMNHRLHHWPAYTSKVCHYCSSFKERNSPLYIMQPTTLKSEKTIHTAYEKRKDQKYSGRAIREEKKSGEPCFLCLTFSDLTTCRKQKTVSSVQRAGGKIKPY